MHSSSGLTDKHLNHLVLPGSRLKKLRQSISLFRRIGKVGPPTAPFMRGSGRGRPVSRCPRSPVGKRLDQGARLSFKAKPGILGGQFQNPLAPGIMVIQAKQTLGLCTA